MNTTVFGQTDPAYDEPPLPPQAEHAVELEPGCSIQGKYTVLGVLGHGGFAVVYDAKHDGLGRRVAIKVLHLREDTPLALVERFRREARISALVRHPNVLEVYDTGALADGSPYLVMERVNGENLSALIRRGPLPIATAVEVTRQVLHGLSAIEEQGIVHRDIKPDNLMLHDTGDGMPIVKLVDFGISKRVAIEPQARLTCHGALVGTPQYMSPEQIRGEEVDVRSDIYATGAVLYEALTGHAPHESTSFSELVVSVLNGSVVPVCERRTNCPAELERIVLKSLARQPAQRYGSPREVLEALATLADDLELPRGADAFRATDGTLPSLTPARSSLVSVRRLSTKLGRPAQLALVVLLLSTPGQVQHVHGAAAVLGVEASSEASLSASSSSAVNTLLQRVTNAPIAARPEAQPEPQQELLPDQAEGSRGVEAEVAKAQPPSAQPAPTEPVRAVEPAPELAAQGPREPAAKGSLERTDLAAERQHQTPGEPRVAPAAQPVTPQPSAQQLEPVVPEPAAAPVTLDPAQRRRLDDTLQSALAALVRGHLDAARASYGAAIKLAPREPAAYRGLGLVAARLGSNQEARAALHKYLALAAHAPDAAAIRERLAALP